MGRGNQTWYKSMVISMDFPYNNSAWGLGLVSYFMTPTIRSLHFVMLWAFRIWSFTEVESECGPLGFFYPLRKKSWEQFAKSCNIKRWNPSIAAWIHEPDGGSLPSHIVRFSTQPPRKSSHFSKTKRDQNTLVLIMDSIKLHHNPTKQPTWFWAN